VKAPAYRSPGQWSRLVTAIVRSYHNDPENGHAAEDEALWEFIHYRASQGDSTARRLERLDRHPRDKWYA
jgi:hypothetical protein